MADLDGLARELEIRDVPSSDGSLLKRFQSGEVEAATRLYSRYAARLSSLAWTQRGADLASRFDPDDIVQSIFRTFFRRAAEGHYDVPEGQDLWRLLLVIALQKIRDTCSFHRAAKRDVRTTQSIETIDRSAASRPVPSEIGLAELKMVVDELLGGLPASHRSIVELRIEGFQVDEIARKTGRSRRSVERGLQEFRDQLGAILREGD
jgi:RNA polymerase sigma factor (sigma-70 family)